MGSNLLDAVVATVADDELLADMRARAEKDPDGFQAELIGSNLSERALIMIGRLFLAVVVSTVLEKD